MNTQLLGGKKKDLLDLDLEGGVILLLKAPVTELFLLLNIHAHFT